MNFLAHALLAHRDRPEPHFALGAMLPDLAPMAGVRPRRAPSRAIDAGLAHHHAIDAAFHGAPAFVGLCERHGASMRAAGLSRGAARALAHVGAEMLLDGCMLRAAPNDVAPVRDAFLAGDARTLSVEAGYAPDQAARIAALCARLAALPLDRPPGAVDVAHMLYRRLSSRARLAVAAHQLPAAERAMHRLDEDVRRVAPTLLGETDARRAGTPPRRPPRRSA